MSLHASKRARFSNGYERDFVREKRKKTLRREIASEGFSGL